MGKEREKERQRLSKISEGPDSIKAYPSPCTSKLTALLPAQEDPGWICIRREQSFPQTLPHLTAWV